MSISTVTTAPAWSASRAVSDPVPVPTSSTASVRSSSAVRTIRSTRFRSMRKFCPSLLLACSPWASKRPRRYESVWRGEGTGGVAEFWHDLRSATSSVSGGCTPSLTIGFAGMLNVMLSARVSARVWRCRSNSRFTAAPGFLQPECRVVAGVRDQHHAEPVRLDLHHRQAHAVHRDRPLRDQQLAELRRVSRTRSSASRRFGSSPRTRPGAVDVAGDEVAADGVARAERTLQVHAVTGRELPESWSSQASPARPGSRTSSPSRDRRPSGTRR